MKLAKRITGTSLKSFGMYEQAARLQGDTSDLIHLEVGRPHADTPCGNQTSGCRCPDAW